MSHEGHIHDGTVVFDQPVSLPEGSRVRVELIPATSEHLPDGPSLLERLRPFVGILDLPEDAALNHDHYLYGSPKKT